VNGQLDTTSLAVAVGPDNGPGTLQTLSLAVAIGPYRRGILNQFSLAVAISGDGGAPPPVEVSAWPKAGILNNG
jgi:hypothetical protein